MTRWLLALALALGAPGAALADGPEPARLSDASHMPEPTTPPASSSDSDRRPMYVGLGLIGLALVFLWNRRQRERFEPDARPARSTDHRDDDADDLHAAARGDERSDDR